MDTPVTLRPPRGTQAMDGLVAIGVLGLAAYQVIGTSEWIAYAIIFGPVIAFGLLRLWNIAFRVGRLTPTRLDYCNGFAWRGIDRGDVKGWRWVSNRYGSWYHLVPKDGGDEVSIPAWLFDHPAVKSWLEHIGDVVPVEKAEADAAIEADPAYGPDVPARRKRKVTLQVWVILTALPVAMLFFLGMALRWYSWFVLAAFALLPLFGLTLDRIYPRQFRFALEGGWADRRPSLIAFYGTSGFLVPIFALDVYTIIDGWSLFVIALCAGVLLSAYVLWRSLALRRSVWGVLGVAVLAVTYADFAIGFADSYADPGRRWSVSVPIERTSEAGGLTVTLAPWQGNPHTSEISVTRTQFEVMKKSGTACVIAGQGLIGLGWYRFEACADRSAGMH